jgi:hypothetical protein
MDGIDMAKQALVVNSWKAEKDKHNQVDMGQKCPELHGKTGILIDQAYIFSTYHTTGRRTALFSLEQGAVSHSDLRIHGSYWTRQNIWNSTSAVHGTGAAWTLL